ncbi:hypothetical protein RND81_02G216100 [Saponaria officinalis]|uniref:Uncharacterized protein n=1 Tax=Saponaria officinalis TaxID=3572 RepID=A0AAW1MSA4_SAPOF
MNNAELRSNLDTIDELRTKPSSGCQKQVIAKSYNENVRVRAFQVGDLLRKVFQNTQNLGVGKFAYNWESPYQIESVVGNGVYRLMTLDGQPVPRPWNVVHLKKYHL